MSYFHRSSSLPLTEPSVGKGFGGECSATEVSYKHISIRLQVANYQNRTERRIISISEWPDRLGWGIIDLMWTVKACKGQRTFAILMTCPARLPTLTSAVSFISGEYRENESAHERGIYCVSFMESCGEWGGDGARVQCSRHYVCIIAERKHVKYLSP